MIPINLTGRRFGRLIALNVTDKARWRSAHAEWACKCDCGTVASVRSSCLISGQTKSCGCLRSVRLMKHGQTKRRMNRSPEYNTWKGMRNRCRDRNHCGFKNYGGRGISVCSRWDDFDNFLSDMGPKPSPRHSIDRINNDGNYEPSNCRWATRSEQNRNQRRYQKQPSSGPDREQA